MEQFVITGRIPIRIKREIRHKNGNAVTARKYAKPKDMVRVLVRDNNAVDARGLYSSREKSLFKSTG
jgi:hypothetical protein